MHIETRFAVLLDKVTGVAVVGLELLWPAMRRRRRSLIMATCVLISDGKVELACNEKLSRSKFNIANPGICYFLCSPYCALCLLLYVVDGGRGFARD